MHKTRQNNPRAHIAPSAFAVRAKRFAQYSLLLTPLIAHSSYAATPAGGEAIDVVVTDTKVPDRALIRLETRHAHLNKVLDALAKKTGVRLHQRDLPEEFVSAMCTGASVKQVLECLLGPSANLVVRFPNGTPQTTATTQPSEIWVLGKSHAGSSRTDDSLSGRCEPAVLPHEPAPIEVRSVATDLASNQTSTNVGSENTESPLNTHALIAQSADDDAKVRADAVASLAVEANRHEHAVRQAFQVSLQDDDPDVRAQALFGLAGNQDAWARAAIKEALRDEDVSVRLMAVDSAGDDQTLLQDALSDGDETVRAFAALRLGME